MFKDVRQVIVHDLLSMKNVLEMVLTVRTTVGCLKCECLLLRIVLASDTDDNVVVSFLDLV